MGTRFSEGELDELLDQLDFEELDLINRYVDPDVSSFPVQARSREAGVDRLFPLLTPHPIDLWKLRSLQVFLQFW